ncbi:MAG TPA: apolipoprotein N-acyltransferase, partial [Tianweitania sediminis]|nr:apolipoprotein N-acyltransferase [Tianweitania sediminis]
AIGYAAMPVPLLMQSAVVVSVTGITALTVFVFAMPAMAASRKGRRAGFILGLLIVAAHVGFGYARLSAAVPAETTMPVRLVQPSILQSAKWDRAERDKIFGTYLEMSAVPPAAGAPAPQLIIWPETAVPFILNDRPDALSTLGDLLTDGQQLLAGTIRSEVNGTQTRYYNAVTAIGDAGQILDAVDKVHLVPFGEYVPFSSLLERFGVSKIVALPEDFSASKSRGTLTLPGGLKAAAFICYEIIFDEVVRRDAQDMDVLINVTNDAWFGDTAGPYQHFRQAQLRAVETGLPLIRAANNGISGVVDAYGRVNDAFGIDAVGTLDVAVPLGKALESRWVDPSAVGWLIVGVLACAGLIGTIRARRPDA